MNALKAFNDYLQGIVDEGSSELNELYNFLPEIGQTSQDYIVYFMAGYIYSKAKAQAIMSDISLYLSDVEDGETWLLPGLIDRLNKGE
jgi:hypothetical protein